MENRRVGALVWFPGRAFESCLSRAAGRRNVDENDGRLMMFTQGANDRCNDYFATTGGSYTVWSHVTQLRSHRDGSEGLYGLVDETHPSCSKPGLILG